MLNSCFCIRWDVFVTQCIAVCLGREMSTHYFSCSVGTGMDSTKKRRDNLCRICVVASGGIRGSRGAFLCLRGVKCRHTIFHARVGMVRFS
jgi:hypothetical protein